MRRGLTVLIWLLSFVFVKPHHLDLGTSEKIARCRSGARHGCACLPRNHIGACCHICKPLSCYSHVGQARMVSRQPQVPDKHTKSVVIGNDSWRGYLYKYPTSTRSKSPGCSFYQQLLTRVLVAIQSVIKDYYILNSFKDLDCSKYPGQ